VKPCAWDIHATFGRRWFEGGVNLLHWGVALQVNLGIRSVHLVLGPFWLATWRDPHD